MNSSPMMTGAVVFGGGSAAALVLYLFQIVHADPLPSLEVAGVIAGIVAGLAHWVGGIVNQRLGAAQPKGPTNG